MSKILELTAENEAQLCSVGNALSSPTRIQILKLLYYNSYNVGEIAQKLDIPTSSAANHIRILEGAGLIQTKLQPGNRGSMKLCSRKNDFLNIRLIGNPPNVDQVTNISMPVGAYTNCEITPTCGLANESAPIGFEDRPSDFFLPERIGAQLIWSSSGFVEYKFPSLQATKIAPKSLTLSFEACSEAPNFQEDWKSDITIWVNDVECSTWQSPGDFGSRRGRLNPSWWDNGVTQYGMLTTLKITETGSLINSYPCSDICIHDLNINASDYITIRIGNKPDSKYIGGFNIFGEKFGDYEQDIVLSLIY